MVTTPPPSQPPISPSHRSPASTPRQSFGIDADASLENITSRTPIRAHRTRPGSETERNVADLMSEFTSSPIESQPSTPQVQIQQQTEPFNDDLELDLDFDDGITLDLPLVARHTHQQQQPQTAVTVPIEPVSKSSSTVADLPPLPLKSLAASEPQLKPSHDSPIALPPNRPPKAVTVVSSVPPTDRPGLVDTVVELQPVVASNINQDEETRSASASVVRRPPPLLKQSASSDSKSSSSEPVSLDEVLARSSQRALQLNEQMRLRAIQDIYVNILAAGCCVLRLGSPGIFGRVPSKSPFWLQINGDQLRYGKSPSKSQVKSLSKHSCVVQAPSGSRLANNLYARQPECRQLALLITLGAEEFDVVAPTVEVRDALLDRLQSVSISP